MKKIINLVVYFDDIKNEFKTEMRHKCDTTETALDVIQEFINRKRRGKKLDA